MPLETENLHRAVDLLKTLGKAYLSKNQYREATEKFENILRLGFKDADVYRHLAIALAGQKLYTPEAQRVYLWAVEKFPHDRSLCLHVAQAALHHQAEDDHASNFYFAALKFHPPFAKDLYLRLHTIFHRQGKYDESFQTLKQALYLEKSGAAQLVTRLTQLGWRYDRTPELILTLQFLLGNNEANSTIRRCLAFSLAHSLIRHHNQTNALEGNAPFNGEADLPLLRIMLPKPETLTTLETVREYCTLRLALLSASRSDKNFTAAPAMPSNMATPKAFEYHSLLDALPLEDVLAEPPSSTAKLQATQLNVKTESHPAFDWHRDFLKSLPAANLNTDLKTAAAKDGSPLPHSLEVAALLILTPILSPNPNGSQETLTPAPGISASQAINLVTRHLQATTIAKRIYSLSDGIIVFAANFEELLEVSIALLKKTAQYNSQVPIKDQIVLRATLHGVPAERRFVLSEENNSASNLNGLKLLYTGLHLLLAERDTQASSSSPQQDELFTSTRESRLLFSRKIFETLAGAKNFTVQYWGNTYWGVPGWHDEVCELVWFNPLEYISDKMPYALERFLVLEKLQSQTTYDTYRTRDRTLERPVILKALRLEIYVRRRRDKSSHAETVNAIRRLGRLEHPGIALIYDMGTHEDIFYFVREHIEGENLAQSFAKQQRLSPVEAVRLVLEICRILRYAHQNGVYHGNLKPSNIWRVKSSVLSEPPVHARALLAPPPSQSEKITIALKISDFFIPGYHEITSPNWYYFPPELHLQNADARLTHLRASADIYALGMLLYDCLSGSNPFRAVSFPVERSIWEEVQLTPFSILTNNTTGLLPALDEVIQRATHREPFQRHQTIDEFETALRRVLKGSSAPIKTHF